MLLESQFARLGVTADFADAQTLHEALVHWNHDRLALGKPTADWSARLAMDSAMRRVEGRFIEDFRLLVAPLVAEAPRKPQAFVEWFEQLKQTGPGQWDPLFDWLGAQADMDEMKWFLTQEAAGEAGFEDLVAMTQVKLPQRAKLELARNYWDEMGRGHAAGMHGPMLERTVLALGLKPSIERTLWQSLALANTMTALAANRRYVYQSVGALGVVELTAPTRVSLVADGLKRLSAPAVARKYFALHAHLDVEHSKAWNAEALIPLVQDDPECAPFIAEGAIMRLLCGEQCFNAYRGVLWAARLPHAHAAE
ncbi:iron-containing redox enzyme family protein [Phenylobacterium sp.]|uniref:iron-containing redox enzyme family protein n=1 Tax=Phenylobacterium sp. TaxID=1871053 RepID=UPI0035AF4934